MIRIRKSLTTDIYLAYDSAHATHPVLYFEWGDSTYLKNIQDFLVQKRFRIDSIDQFRLTANLHLDERVPLSVINALRQELRKANVTNVYYSTGARQTKYPSHYPEYRRRGISQQLPSYHSAFAAFLDSAERLDPARYQVRLVESDMYRLLDLRKTNRVELIIDTAQAYLNGTPVTPAHLSRVLYALTQEYSPNFVVLYAPDETISYEKYIEYLDIVHSITDRLRNEATYALYGHSFDCWQYAEDCEAVEEVYPRNIIEWTIEEKRLSKLVDNAKNRPETETLPE